MGVESQRELLLAPFLAQAALWFLVPLAILWWMRWLYRDEE